MARNHMTQLAVAVNVLMLLPLVSTQCAGSNLQVHSTEWHLEGSEVFLNFKAGIHLYNVSKKCPRTQVNCVEIVPYGLFCVDILDIKKIVD